MAVMSTIAIVNIRTLGDYALTTATDLGESAIEDSTSHLISLGEEIIKQKARDVATQVEMYLGNHPDMTLVDMRNDTYLRNIVVQTVGTTGYTTLIDPVNTVIVIHKFPGQERDVRPLKDTLPSFWNLLTTSITQETAGYYDWLEVDGSINQKYASIVPVANGTGLPLTIWATTYIVEFSAPAEETKNEINDAILESSNYLKANVSGIQDMFVVAFTILITCIIGLTLLLSRVITSPILALKRGAEAIGHGNLDYKLEIKSEDELGDLEKEFNKMGTALKSDMEQLNRTSNENIIREKRIQNYLRLYAQKISEAQEAERRRVARELHDGTVQSLVVIARHLDDIAAGESELSITDIRAQVQSVMEEVRHFSQELRPSILDDLGLVPAVEWLASDMTNNHKIAVDIKIAGDPVQLSSQAELALFRIVQEALTNVRKHSQATRAQVILSYSEHSVKFIIQDYGRGFDIPAGEDDLTREGKLGLVGMFERVQLLRGSLKIASHPGEGTTITVEIPF
jgi:signal transduction histidine kinase